MTLQELSDAWNELANAGLGRGTRAPVDAALAAEVKSAYERFREWLADLGPFDEIRERLVSSDASAWWVAKHNALRAKIARQGRAVPDALAVPSSIFDDVASGSRHAFIGLAVFGVGLAAAAYAWGRR